VATAVKVQWLWDIRYIDAPVLRWRDTGGDPDLDETLYYCNDANMNVTALVDASSGNVVERYLYSPYGQPEIYNGSWTAVAWADSKKNEILYCGYRWDPETGLYHVRHRYYHPTLGRWGRRDPKGYLDDMNIYEYAAGAPVEAVDPLGLRVATFGAPERIDDHVYYEVQTVESAAGTLTSRDVKTCNVVIMIGHQSAVEAWHFDAVGDLAAVGYLTCWGDYYNRAADRSASGANYDGPRPGIISGFPGINSTVGVGSYPELQGAQPRGIAGVVQAT